MVKRHLISEKGGRDKAQRRKRNVFEGHDIEVER